MKNLISVLLVIVLMTLSMATIQVSATQEFELWTESPGITSGLTMDDMNIFRANKLNLLSVHKLSRINSNLWLTVCEEKNSGSPATSYLHIYLLLVSGENYVILYKDKPTVAYYSGYKQNVMDLSSSITNTSWYTSRGYEVPYYIMTPNNPYVTSSNPTIYYIVTQSGKISSFQTEKNYSDVLIFYDGVFYARQDYQAKGSSYRWYDSTLKKYYTKLFPLYLDSSGTVLKDTNNPVISHFETNYVLTLPHTVLSVSSDVASTSSGWDANKYDAFPDGRRVGTHWRSNDSSYTSRSLWYDIYNSDTTLKSTGNTGYSQSNTINTTTPIFVKTINNTKFVVAEDKVGGYIFKEYYRIAVTQQDDNGETTTGGGNIGKKTITPPTTSDTIPTNSQIDFGQDSLPLGYYLNPNLKNDINAITLPDIIIVKKTGYVSGSNNTGQSLAFYDYYDYSMGSSFIRFYSNGSNLMWYCNNPENLTVGTHSKSLVIDGKTVYFKVKILAPPTSAGTTTIKF